MQLRSSWVLALVVGVLQPGVVHADAPRALMMTPMGDADAEMTNNALTEVRATLEHQGVVFVTPPRGLSLECETVACRAAAAAQAGAEMAVTVLVWQPTSFRAEGRVEVALTDVSGETVGAEVDFAADELLAAVQAARGALESFGRRARVALEITGMDGAAVLVDGRPVGTVPYRGSLGTGPHRIRVVVNGEVLLTEEVNVEQGAEPIMLRVDESGRASEGDEADDAGGSSTALLAAGTGVAVASAGAVLWVVVEAVRSGCTERNTLGECTRERELRRGPAVAVGVLGAAMMATGVVLILRSRSGGDDAGPEVSARVSPTSAALNVSF